MFLLKKPSAWIPVLLSLIMLGILMLYLAKIIPPDPTGDEGTGAHLFQIWLVLETMMIPIFAIKWLPKMQRQALLTLAIQITLVIIVCAPVFYFKW